jgi:hypothetical protein
MEVNFEKWVVSRFLDLISGFFGFWDTLMQVQPVFFDIQVIDSRIVGGRISKKHNFCFLKILFRKNYRNRER